MVGLGFGAPGVVGTSAASGVSADASTIVGVGPSLGYRSTSTEALSWTSNGPTGLGFLPGGSNSSATGVSADGSTVVGVSLNSSSVNEAFRWTSGGGMVGLGFLPGVNGRRANAVSADGSTVIGFTGSVGSRVGFNGGGGQGQAFRWTSATGMVGLGSLIVSANAVSADGSTIVGQFTSPPGQPFTGVGAFIWEGAHGMRPIGQVLTGLGVDLTGWELTDATGISADGQTIVGLGTDPSGKGEGWIAVLPEPGTGFLVVTGLVALASRRRRVV